MAAADGQSHGGIEGHFLLTHRGSSTLLGQALHSSDPRRTAA